MAEPKVRFKRDDGSSYPAWKTSSFSEAFIALNNNTYSRDMLNYNGGDAKNIHYGDILVKFGDICDIQKVIIPYVNKGLAIQKYASLKDGDIILADTAEDETVGKAVEIYNTKNDVVISGVHTMVCRPVNSFAPKYLGYCMNSPAFHNQLRPFMQGVKVTSIGRSNISEVEISSPSSIEEQQKIADFLSSVDDVITASEEEVANLETQKKAVMKKIFSQEVRFKRADGSVYPMWLEKRIGDICNTYSGGTPKAGNDAYYGGNIPFIRSGEVHSDATELFLTEAGLKNSSAKMVAAGDIIMALYGATSGEIDISKIDGAINQAILCIKPDDAYDKKFLVEVFRNYKDDILKTYLQGGQGNLSAQIILSLTFDFPCLEEQHLIADFLSSFDEAIVAAKKELELWKQLKKGLLQQMFV